MGFFSKLFGSDEVIKKTVDGVYNGIDKLVYTEEEKAEMRLKSANYFLKLLKAYEPFKLAQRFLALTVTIPYVFVWLISAGMFVWGGSTGDNNIVEVSKELAKWNNEVLGMPVALILGFYFSGGMVEGIVDRFKKEK